MTNLSDKEHATYVQTMFTRIAGKYDFMNRIMTGGQDQRWRRRTLDRARIPPHARVLDLGSGTGDLAAEIVRRDPTAFVVAGDYTMEMMLQGKKRKDRSSLVWTNLDALELPFQANSFDVIVSGYLMRNVSDVHRSWAEQYRVLKPGGCVVCLDTTPPPQGPIGIAIRFYLKSILPLLGTVLAGDKKAYTYLPKSTEHFLAAEDLMARMVETGFKNTGFHRLAAGTMAIHWGYK